MQFQLHNYQEKEATEKDFQTIPGVGKKLSQELFNLGYRKVSELKEEDPDHLYLTVEMTF
jgi:predicted flap endonuclease-1-like 5' DNA nuclease